MNNHLCFILSGILDNDYCPRTAQNMKRILRRIIFSFFGSICIIFFISQLTQLVSNLRFLIRAEKQLNDPTILADPIKYNWIVQMSCENETINEGRSYISVYSIVLNNCNFARFSQLEANGGVVFMESDSNLSVDECMFYYCQVSNYFWGGAIFVKTQSCSISKTCVSQNYAYEGKFASISGKECAYLRYISINNCTDSMDGGSTLLLSKCHQILTESNLSMNRAEEASGIFIQNPKDFECSRSTFSYNDASEEMCIHISGGKGNFFSINYIHNTSPDNCPSIFVDDGANFIFHNCVFVNNLKILFGADESDLIIVNSTIFHNGLIFSDSVKTSNIILSYTSEMRFIYFRSYYCEAEVDFYPNLTFRETPSHTQSSSQIQHTTNAMTVDITHNITPMNTPSFSNDPTNQMTQYRSIESTLSRTSGLSLNDETLIQTLLSTLQFTPESTLLNSFDISANSTPIINVFDISPSDSKGFKMNLRGLGEPILIILISVTILSLLIILIISCTNSYPSDDSTSEFHDSLI